MNVIHPSSIWFFCSLPLSFSKVHRKIVELFLCYSEQIQRKKSTRLSRILSSNIFFRSVCCLMSDASLNSEIGFLFPFPSAFQLFGVFYGPAASSVCHHFWSTYTSCNWHRTYKLFLPAGHSHPMASRMPSTVLWISSELVFSEISIAFDKKDNFSLDYSSTLFPWLSHNCFFPQSPPLGSSSSRLSRSLVEVSSESPLTGSDFPRSR